MTALELEALRNAAMTLSERERGFGQRSVDWLGRNSG
jgi:hypothetical protein